MSEFINSKLGSLQIFLSSKGFDKLFYAILIIVCLGTFASGAAGENLSEILAWATGGFATLSNATPSEILSQLLPKQKRDE